MTPSQLKSLVIQHNEESEFFSRSNMKFAGDTMSNFGVRAVTIATMSEPQVEVWELYRKRPTKMGKGSFHFHKNGARCFPFRSTI